jgi:magnesium-transporting ATPase (P-type)
MLRRISKSWQNLVSGAGEGLERRHSLGVNSHDQNHSSPRRKVEPSKGLSSAAAAELLAKHGPNELEDKKTPKWFIFVSQLYQPMPIMM